MRTRMFGFGASGVVRLAAASVLALGVVAAAVPVSAQYPDVEQPKPDTNDPGVPSPPPAPPAPGPSPGASSGASSEAPAELTEEEKAEREGRRACKAAICAAFHNKKPGDDIACSVLKSFRKEQLDKMLAKAKASWPWGKVRCTTEVRLKRDVLVKALTEDKIEAKLDPHQVTCTVERGAEPAAEVKLDFAPKVTFEKGKATKAQVNWGKLEAPTLVKAAMWPATATDNTVNALGATLVEDINDFITNKCLEVKSEWDGK